MIREAEEIQITYNDLPIKPQTIFRILGYGNDNIPKYVMEMVIELLGEAHQYMELKADFGIFPVTGLDY